MNSLRNLVGFILAFALAAFAAPGLAQSPAKLHSIDVRPTAPPAASSLPNVFVTITNETPSGGNSTINSFTITPPAGVTVATPLSGDNPGATVEKRADGKIYVNGFTGLKAGRRDPYLLTINLRVTYNSLTCGATYTWTSVAYAGNSFSQETFASVQGTGTAGITNQPTNPTQTYGCGYKVSVTPASVARGSTPALSATLTNESSVSITSLTLSPPSGITFSPNSWSQTFATGNTTIALQNAKVACNAAGGQWTSIVAPAGFTKTAADSTTTPYGACSLVFASLPTSIAPGEPFNVVIKLVDGDGATIPGFGGEVTLVATGTGCTLSEPGTQTNANGVVTINGVELALTNATSCALRATANYDGETFVKDSSALKVFNGVLGCVPGPVFSALDLQTLLSTAGTGTFIEPTSGATVGGQTAFIGGARGPGDIKNGATCTEINYGIVNNIPTTISTYRIDTNGNYVPEGGWSFTWDESIAPNPVIGVITTYRSEWGDAVTGLPTRTTLVCTVVPCPGPPSPTSTAWKPMQSCLATTVIHSSVPVGEPACLVQETWTVIPVGDPYYCDLGTKPTMPAGADPLTWKARCLQPTAISIIGKDPVFIR